MEAIYTLVPGPSRLNNAVLRVGIDFNNLTVSGQRAHVDPTHFEFSGQYAGKVCNSGKTVQSLEFSTSSPKVK